MEYNVPYTIHQLMELLGIASRSSFRKTYLVPALDKKLVFMTMPDKPTSKNQTYIKY